MFRIFGVLIATFVTLFASSFVHACNTTYHESKPVRIRCFIIPADPQVQSAGLVTTQPTQKEKNVSSDQAFETVRLRHVTKLKLHRNATWEEIFREETRRAHLPKK